MSGLSRRHTMRRKDARELLDEISQICKIDVKRFEEGELGDGSKVYILDGNSQFFRDDSELYPTLTCECLDQLPSVIVDMGAIPYVCNGADVMSPGIVKIEGNFEVGELVVVRDVTHGKPLAIGLALESVDHIKSSVKGRMIENIHYVGDDLWEAIS